MSQHKPAEHGSHWVCENWICVGHVHFMFFVSISFALGTQPVFGGIWAWVFCPQLGDHGYLTLTTRTRVFRLQQPDPGTHSFYLTLVLLSTANPWDFCLLLDAGFSTYNWALGILPPTISWDFCFLLDPGFLSSA